MSKTLLDDLNYWIATEGEGQNILRVTQGPLRLPGVREELATVTVPLDKLRTALRRVGQRRPWDDHFLDRAALIAGQSKDPSTRVGAVIVDVYCRQVSDGYNGFPRGVDDSKERLADREVKYPLTLHAELNAILFAQRNLTNCTIYIWPSPPCTRCAAAIIQVGIIRIVSPPASSDMLSRWKAELQLAETVLKEAGVQQDFIGQAVEP